MQRVSCLLSSLSCNNEQVLNGCEQYLTRHFNPLHLVAYENICQLSRWPRGASHNVHWLVERDRNMINEGMITRYRSLTASNTNANAHDPSEIECNQDCSECIGCAVATLDDKQIITTRGYSNSQVEYSDILDAEYARIFYRLFNELEFLIIHIHA